MIIVPVVAKNLNEALGQIERANSRADAIELRLDNFEKLGDDSLARMIKACGKGCICTCRTVAEGGKFSGKDETAMQVLMGAIKNGAHFVDLEFGMKPQLRKKLMDYANAHNAQVILSKHFTLHTPDKKELKSLFEKMAKEKGAHVVKIVTKATKHSDNSVVLELFKDAKKKRIKLIAFCMGEHGKDSRVLSRLLGAFGSFASIRKGFESAEGQIPVDEFRKIEREMVAFFD